MITSNLVRTAFAAFAALAALVLATGSRAAPMSLPLDTETSADGVPVACTGIGQTRLDPKWQAWPVRVELANARSEYLVDGAIVVRDRHGHQVLAVTCDAPWILMRLPPGAYTVEGRLLDSAARPRSASFSPPKSGQLRLVLQFPDA